MPSAPLLTAPRMVSNSSWKLSLSTRTSPFHPSDPQLLHDLCLIIVRKGNGWLESAGTRIPIGLGQFLVLGPHTSGQLRDEPQDPLVVDELRVSPELLEIAALDPTKLPAGIVALDADRTSRLAGLMRRVEIERSRNLPHSCALATSLTLRLLADLASDGKPPQEKSGRPWYQGDSMARMEAYVQDLDEHFFEATNLNVAAAGLGLSRRRFTQLFRQSTDSSWLAYVRKLRIRHAQRLLTEPQKTVLSIAFECGFEDLSTFYRAFKREVGISPNLWRKG